jgi:Rap1a immunity proteins
MRNSTTKTPTLIIMAELEPQRIIPVKKGLLSLLLTIGFPLTTVATGAPTTPNLPPEFEQTTVQAFFSVCNGGDLGKIYCIGYVSGLMDSMVGLGGAKLGPKNVRMCGQHVTYGAAVQAFMNWAQKNPEKWSHDRLEGVTSALSESWPCN